MLFPFPLALFPYPFPFPSWAIWLFPYPWNSHGNGIPMGFPTPMHTSTLKTFQRQIVNERCTWLKTDTVQLDPEIDRVDLWRSIWGKYRSTRSIDSTLALLTTQLDSAPRRSTRSTWPTLYLILLYLPTFFYRAMHISAKRGIAIACRLSVCLSVVFFDVGELWSHKLEFFENNFTIS